MEGTPPLSVNQLIDLTIASLDNIEASHQMVVSELQQSHNSQLQTIEIAATERIKLSSQQALRQISSYQQQIEKRDALIERLQEEVKSLRAELSRQKGQ